jgi:hypothetical protein
VLGRIAELKLVSFQSNAAHDDGLGGATMLMPTQYHDELQHYHERRHTKVTARNERNTERTAASGVYRPADLY